MTRKKTLKQYAEEHGYGNELCIFLDKLEKNLDLTGLGLFVVFDAIEKKLHEYKVVKIALANRGRAFSEFLPGSTKKSKNVYTLEDWEKDGTEEFLKHCTPAGKFRYADFKYETHPNVDPWLFFAKR